MFAKLTKTQRIQMGLVLALAFLLVLGSNRLDQRHYSIIQTTVNSVYKDRVVVQDIIYQLNNFFHEKKLRFMQHESPTINTSENGTIDALLVVFKHTKLTQEEAKLLNNLKIHYSFLTGLEHEMQQNPIAFNKASSKKVLQTLQEIEQDLNGLAAIQLSESAQLTQLSIKSLGMNILLSKLEVAFLIIIGVSMLFLIFYPVKTMQVIP